jgi:hypothetical protein
MTPGCGKAHHPEDLADGRAFLRFPKRLNSKGKPTFLTYPALAFKTFSIKPLSSLIDRCNTKQHLALGYRSTLRLLIAAPCACLSQHPAPDYRSTLRLLIAGFRSSFGRSA